ncbi:MAG TPA: hypothetical protein VK283_11700 [Acidimicrobiales bacterium]|nr:hypothetical protein [Acidimicrobiales bacterium]
MGKGIGEPDRQPTGGSDQPPARIGSGEGGDAPITAPGARSGLGADPISRAAMVRREWMHTQVPARAPWKKRALWFVVAVLAGSMFALILLAFN